MLRKNWWLAVAAVGSVLGGQTAAKAQECVDDFGCGPGLKCGWTGTNGSDVDVGGASEPGAKPGAGADIAAPCAPDSNGCNSPPPPARMCVPFERGDCETTDDCMAGLECQKYVETAPCAAPEPTKPTDGSGGVAADPIPSPPCDSEPTEARIGYCVLPTTVCNSDDDCLLGLTCVPSNASSGSSSGSAGSTGSGGATVGSGGGADPAEPPSNGDIAEPVPPVDEKPVNPPDEGPSTCQYQPPSCENNAPCDAGYTCTKVATGSWCNAGEACAPGETCDQTPPECGTDYSQQCLPTQDPCTTDSDCSEGWVCADFGGDDGLEAPESWGTNGQAVKSCLPEGIALAANSANGGGGFANPEASGSGDGKGEPPSEPTTGHDDSDNSGSAGTGKGSASGCSVGASGNSLMGGWLLVGALGLISRRRRRA
jgi:hypothetical protein